MPGLLSANTHRIKFSKEYSPMKRIMVFLFSFMFAFCLGGCHSKAASIGIIGGADGPIAIFITSGTNWLSVCGWIGAIIVTILVVLIFRSNKKKK